MTTPRLIATLAALTLTACGGEPQPEVPGGSVKDDAVDVVRDYQTAFVDGDTAAACELLSGNGRVEVIATATVLGADPDCEAAIQATLELAGQDDLDRIARATDELGPDDVQVTGDQATVTLRSGKTLALVKSNDGWLIDRP